jgi:hypothetical protein
VRSPILLARGDYLTAASSHINEDLTSWRDSELAFCMREESVFPKKKSKFLHSLRSASEWQLSPRKTEGKISATQFAGSCFSV